MGTKTKSKTTKKQTVSGRVDVRVEPLIVELKRKCMISVQIYQEIADGILIMSLLFLIGIEFGFFCEHDIYAQSRLDLHNVYGNGLDLKLLVILVGALVFLQPIERFKRFLKRYKFSEKPL